MKNPIIIGVMVAMLSFLNAVCGIFSSDNRHVVAI